MTGIFLYHNAALVLAIRNQAGIQQCYRNLTGTLMGLRLGIRPSPLNSS
jgi:hypothetical protein